MFSLLHEGPYVPTYVGLEVLAHAILDESDSCVTLAKVDHDEALHAHRFCGRSDKRDSVDQRTYRHVEGIS